MNWESSENEGLRRLVQELRRENEELREALQEVRIELIREMDDRPVLRADRVHVVK